MRPIEKKRPNPAKEKPLFSQKRRLNFELLEERRFLSGTPWAPEPFPVECPILHSDSAPPEPQEFISRMLYNADLIGITAGIFAEAMENGSKPLEEINPRLGTVEFEQNSIILAPSPESGLGDRRFIIRFGDQIADIFASFKSDQFTDISSSQNIEGRVFQVFGGLLELAADIGMKMNPENGNAEFAIFEGTDRLEFRLLLENMKNEKSVEYAVSYEDDDTVVFDIQDADIEPEATFQVALMATRVAASEKPNDTESGTNSPSAPSDFRMISASGNMAGFSWNPVSGVTLDNYFIYLAKAEKNSFKNISLDEEGPVSLEIGKGKDGRIFVYFFGIEPGETYYFFVRANKDEDNWTDSDAFGFKTKIPTIK